MMIAAFEVSVYYGASAHYAKGDPARCRSRTFPCAWKKDAKGTPSVLETEAKGTLKRMRMFCCRLYKVTPEKNKL